MKKVFLILAVIFIGAAGYYWYMFIKVPVYENCIDMIQPARNPITKEVKYFSNPCQVPIGWEKIKESY